MNIKNELVRIAKELISLGSQPIRKRPDYGEGNDLLHQLAEHAGLDLDEMREEGKKP